MTEILLLHLSRLASDINKWASMTLKRVGGSPLHPGPLGLRPPLP